VVLVIAKDVVPVSMTIVPILTTNKPVTITKNVVVKNLFFCMYDPSDCFDITIIDNILPILQARVKMSNGILQAGGPP
jgi:hypothetical protein